MYKPLEDLESVKSFTMNGISMYRFKGKQIDRLHAYITKVEKLSEVDLQEVQKALNEFIPYTVNNGVVSFGLANNINILQSILDIVKEIKEE